MEILNRKAKFNYEIIEKYDVGVVLTGTEIKSIREGKASFTDSYCYFTDKFLFLKNFHIAEYELGTYNNHDPLRDRILLLNKKELKKIRIKTSEKGYALIPTKMFFSEKNIVKFEIAICKGKKEFDKKNSIKEKDLDRETKRELKNESSSNWK
jgi:SsrA-binding protein